MNTWLEGFHEKTDLNRYPAVAFRGGVGYRKPNGEVESNFVGHRVHYWDNGWKPITLTFDAQGRCDNGFGYLSDGTITYNGQALFRPTHVSVNGQHHALGNIVKDGNALVRSAGQFEHRVIFTERGVREVLTVPGKSGKVGIIANTHAVPQGLFKNPARAYDAQGKILKLEDGFLDSDGIVHFPAVIDPDYSGSTGDNTVYGSDATYSTARSTSTAEIGDTAQETQVGQQPSGGLFYIYRMGVKFDTSGIPDGDDVTACVMKLVCTQDYSTTNFTVQIKKHDWSAADPISSNQETYYDGALAASNDGTWRSTLSMSVNTQYTSNALDATRVSKTGSTYYSILSLEDVNNSSPGGGDEFIYLGTQDNATSGYRPVLTVTHAAAATAAQVIWLS